MLFNDQRNQGKDCHGLWQEMGYENITTETAAYMNKLDRLRQDTKNISYPAFH